MYDNHYVSVIAVYIAFIYEIYLCILKCLHKILIVVELRPYVHATQIYFTDRTCLHVIFSTLAEIS